MAMDGKAGCQTWRVQDNRQEDVEDERVQTTLSYPLLDDRERATNMMVSKIRNTNESGKRIFNQSATTERAAPEGSTPVDAFRNNNPEWSRVVVRVNARGGLASAITIRHRHSRRILHAFGGCNLGTSQNCLAHWGAGSQDNKLSRRHSWERLLHALEGHTSGTLPKYCALQGTRNQIGRLSGQTRHAVTTRRSFELPKQTSLPK